MTPSAVVLIHGAWSRGEQLAGVRDAFEERGYTAYTPTLRHHELPLEEGADKIAMLSLRDYTDDLVQFVESLPSPPLIIGHSLGGLIAQLVAARSHHAGLVAACPAPLGLAGTNPTTVRIALSGRHSRPETKPVYPPRWDLFRGGVANAQPETTARQIHNDLVCESGRVINFEVGQPWRDRAKAARVDYASITGPVLVIGAGRDRIVPPRTARRTAKRFRDGTYAEIPGSDHMVFSGETLPTAMAHIDGWIARSLGPNPNSRS
ncbi:MAG: alpha/beta fold hydrolase [Mycobacterium sp.]|nr:alpha/beta fold hydrolase [Mycobacterium sp.]